MIQLNSLFFAFLAIFLLRSGAQLLLSRLNISYLCHRGVKIPEVVQDVVDEDKFKKASAYNVDSERFHIIATLTQQGLLLVILLAGVLPWLVNIISQWKDGQIVGGLIFFALLGISTNLLHIPFSLYDTFVIEDRYGFNTMTLKTWILDLFKGIVISAILGGLLLWVLLALVVHGGNAWWVWAWIMTSGFEILILWLFPVVIAPS